ncbi:MAG: amino acid racemase [Bryobacteraceae bacterium]
MAVEMTRRSWMTLLAPPLIAGSAGCGALFGQSAAKRIPASEMRSLGLIGGTSWYSTVEYYRYINKAVNDYYGDNTNPPLVLFNQNQQRVFALQREDRWDDIAAMLSEAVLKLKAAGAEAVLFCANTPHKVYDRVVKKTGMRILHIADATGAAMRKEGVKKAGLIGTIFTMEDGFIPARLKERFGVEAIAPASREARVELHRIVQEELDMGVFKPETKKYILGEIARLQEQGAKGIILGCTEFPLIIKQSDVTIPAFDTTTLHAQMAVDFILRRD